MLSAQDRGLETKPHPVSEVRQERKYYRHPLVDPGPAPSNCESPERVWFHGNRRKEPRFQAKQRVCICLEFIDWFIGRLLPALRRWTGLLRVATLWAKGRGKERSPPGPRKMPPNVVRKPSCGLERLPQKPGRMAADLVQIGEAAGAWQSPQTTSSLSLPWGRAGACGHCQVATLRHLV